MSYADILKKKKYHIKTLSDNAIATTFIRQLDIEPLFAEQAWLQLSAFDLTELGMGLLYSILPVEYEPYAVDFYFETPKPEETLQGIWAKFKPVRFDVLYIWMTDFREYIIENFKEEFQPDLLVGIAEKAIYGVTPYARGVYDPILAREFLRATFYKLRLMRTPDMSWKDLLTNIQKFLDLVGITDDNVWNRLMLMFSAQINSFVLGLSLLGRSFLSKTEGEYATIPILDVTGKYHDVKFRTLDHLQFGFILGITPLGYGLLLPKDSIYKLKEGKYDPSIIKIMTEKIRGIIFRLTLSTFAYTNYNKPEEMIDFHKSEKADQYSLLQQQRRQVESWVSARIPPEELNAVRVRQYQNAVLQLLYWKVKRHRWGFGAWKTMTDEQFLNWWLNHWSAQGLNRELLSKLYEDSRIWLQKLREERVSLGERVKKRRLQLALSV